MVGEYRRKREKNNNNPNHYFEILYSDIQLIKTDITIIKEKMKMYEKLIYFILSILAAIFAKIVFFP